MSGVVQVNNKRPEDPTLICNRCGHAQEKHRIVCEGRSGVSVCVCPGFYFEYFQPSRGN